MKKINWNFIFVWFVVLPLLWLVIADQVHGQTAAFVKSDTTTQGNWMNVYGKDGYSIEAGAQALPSYSSFAPQGTLTWTWTSSTTDIRALQNAGMRIAATWYSSISFYFDVNATDSNTHQLAIYQLDWDSYQGGRKQTVQVTNAQTGAVLASQAYTSFVNGVYAIFSYSGHVHIVITNNNAPGNAVASGIFFDTPGGGNVTPPVCPAPVHSAGLAWQPSITPGITGYNVYSSTNGAGQVKLTPSPITATTFSVSGLAAGSSIVFSVTAVNPSANPSESALSTLPTLVVPSP